MILDEGVAHHHFLLTPFLDETSGMSLTILTPREGRQVRMSLTYVGEDQVPVGMQHLDARHFRLDGEDGARDIWFDEQVGEFFEIRDPLQGIPRRTREDGLNPFISHHL